MMWISDNEFPAIGAWVNGLPYFHVSDSFILILSVSCVLLKLKSSC